MYTSMLSPIAFYIYFSITLTINQYCYHRRLYGSLYHISYHQEKEVLFLDFVEHGFYD